MIKEHEGKLRKPKAKFQLLPPASASFHDDGNALDGPP
jgi:hypothetical protein